MFSIPLPPLLVLFHETNYKLVVFKTLRLEQVFSHSVQFIHSFIHSQGCLISVLGAGLQQ